MEGLEAPWLHLPQATVRADPTGPLRPGCVRCCPLSHLAPYTLTYDTCLPCTHLSL